jgi:hypothetical protein
MKGSGVGIPGARRAVTPLLLAGLLALPISLTPREVRAGAWTQPPGHFYAKLEGASIVTDRAFDPDGEEAPYAVDSLRTRTATYRNRQVRGYLEYGFLPRLTGTVSLAYHRLEAEERAARYRNSGFSDLRLGARLGVSERDPVMAVAAEVKVPSGYDAELFPGLGSGDVDACLLLQAGQSFPGGYVTAEAGFTLRSGDLDNELPFSFEIGANPIRRVGLRAVLRGRRSLGSIEASRGRDLNQVDARNLDAAGTVVVGLTDRLDLEAGLSRTISGRNALAGTEFSLGLAAHR